MERRDRMPTQLNGLAEHENSLNVPDGLTNNGFWLFLTLNGYGKMNGKKGVFKFTRTQVQN